MALMKSSKELDVLSNPIWRFLFRGMEISLKKKIRENIRAVRDYLTKHLMIRIENAEDMKSKDDMLAHIIRANLSVDGFGVEEIIDDFFSFFLAGMETTSSSVSFFLLMMIKNSDVCKRVREEVSYFRTKRTWNYRIENLLTMHSSLYYDCLNAVKR